MSSFMNFRMSGLDFYMAIMRLVWFAPDIYIVVDANLICANAKKPVMLPIQVLLQS